MSDKESEILAVAERMVREGGYHGFSFRDIAKEVGIKSASVHYHFPTKEDLGAAVASYYADRFMASLDEPAALIAQKKNPIFIYIDAFRHALHTDKRMCLCGLLGAEVDGLPPAVATATKQFFERNIAWLTDAYRAMGHTKTAKQQSLHTLALLEGAMIISNIHNDPTLFDDATKPLRETL